VSDIRTCRLLLSHSCILPLRSGHSAQQRSEFQFGAFVARMAAARLQAARLREAVEHTPGGGLTYTGRPTVPSAPLLATAERSAATPVRSSAPPPLPSPSTASSRYASPASLSCSRRTPVARPTAAFGTLAPRTSPFEPRASRGTSAHVPPPPPPPPVLHAPLHTPTRSTRPDLSQQLSATRSAPSSDIATVVAVADKPAVAARVESAPKVVPRPSSPRAPPLTPSAIMRTATAREVRGLHPTSYSLTSATFDAVQAPESQRGDPTTAPATLDGARLGSEQALSPVIPASAGQIDIGSPSAAEEAALVTALQELSAAIDARVQPPLATGSPSVAATPSTAPSDPSRIQLTSGHVPTSPVQLLGYSRRAVTSPAVVASAIPTRSAVSHLVEAAMRNITQNAQAHTERVNSDYLLSPPTRIELHGS
jgi:hypothetical protein